MDWNSNEPTFKSVKNYGTSSRNDSNGNSTLRKSSPTTKKKTILKNTKSPDLTNNNTENNDNTAREQQQSLMNKNNGTTFRNVLGVEEYAERVRHGNACSSPREMDQEIQAGDKEIFSGTGVEIFQNREMGMKLSSGGCVDGKNASSKQAVREKDSAEQTRIGNFSDELKDGKNISTDRKTKLKISTVQKTSGKTTTNETVSGKISTNETVSGKISTDKTVRGKTSTASEEISRENTSDGKTLHDSEVSVCDSKASSKETEVTTHDSFANAPEEDGKKSGQKKTSSQNPLVSDQLLKPRKAEQLSSKDEEKSNHGKSVDGFGKNEEARGTINFPCSLSAATPMASQLPQNMGAVSKTYPYYDTQNKFFGCKTPYLAYKDLTTTSGTAYNKILADYASELGSRNKDLHRNYSTNYIDFPALDYPTALLPSFCDDPCVESAFKKPAIGPIPSQKNDLFLHDRAPPNDAAQSASNSVGAVNFPPALSCPISTTFTSSNFINTSMKDTNVCYTELSTSSLTNAGVNTSNAIKSASIIKSNSGPNCGTSSEKLHRIPSQSKDASRAFKTTQESNTKYDSNFNVDKNCTASLPITISSVKSPMSLSMPHRASVSPMSLPKVSQVSLFDTGNVQGLEQAGAARHEVYGVLNPLFDDRLWPPNCSQSLNFTPNKSSGITPGKTLAIDGTCRNVLAPGYLYGATDRSYWAHEKDRNSVFPECSKTNAESGGANEVQLGDGLSKPLESESIFGWSPVLSTKPNAKFADLYSDIIGMNPNAYCDYMRRMALQHHGTDSAMQSILLPGLHQSQKEYSSIQTKDTQGNACETVGSFVKPENRTNIPEENVSKITPQSSQQQFQAIKTAKAIPSAGNKHPAVFGPSLPNKCQGNGHKKSHKSISICDAGYGAGNRSATEPCFSHGLEACAKCRKKQMAERKSFSGLISPGSGGSVLPYTPQDLEEELMYPDTYVKGSSIIQNLNAREQDFFLGKPNRTPKFDQCQRLGEKDGRVISEKRCGQDACATGKIDLMSQSDGEDNKIEGRQQRVLKDDQKCEPKTKINRGGKSRPDFNEKRTGRNEQGKTVRSGLERGRHFEKRLSLPSGSSLNIDNFDRDEYVTFKQRLLDADQDLPRCLRLKPFEPRDESLLGLPLGEQKEKLSLDKTFDDAKLSGSDRNDVLGHSRLIQRRSSDPQLGQIAKIDRLQTSKTNNKNKKKKKQQLPKQRSILYEDDEIEKSNDALHAAQPETILQEEFHRASLKGKNFENKGGEFACSQSCPMELSCTNYAPTSANKDVNSSQTMQTDLTAKDVSLNERAEPHCERSRNFEEGFTAIDISEGNNDGEIEDCDMVIEVKNDGNKTSPADEMAKNRKESRSPYGKYVSGSACPSDKESCNDQKINFPRKNDKGNQNEILPELCEEKEGAASQGGEFFADVACALEVQNFARNKESEEEECAVAIARSSAPSNEETRCRSNASSTSSHEQEYLETESFQKFSEENQISPLESPSGEQFSHLEKRAVREFNISADNYVVCDEAAPRNVGIIKSQGNEAASEGLDLQASNFAAENDAFGERSSTNTGSICPDWSDNSTESKQSLSLIDRRSKASKVKDKLKIKIESSSSMSSLNEGWSETDVVENLDDFEETLSRRGSDIETETTSSEDQNSVKRKVAQEHNTRDATGKQITKDDNKVREALGKKGASESKEEVKKLTKSKSDTPYPNVLLDFPEEASTGKSCPSFENSNTLRLEAKSADETLPKPRSNSEKFTRSLERGSPGLIILENPMSMENSSPVQRRAFTREIIAGLKSGQPPRRGTERKPCLEPDIEMQREKLDYMRKKAEKRRRWTHKDSTSDSSEDDSSQTSSNEFPEDNEPENSGVALSPRHECYLSPPQKRSENKGLIERSHRQKNQEKLSVDITAPEDENKDLQNLDSNRFLPAPEGRVSSREISKGKPQESFHSFLGQKFESETRSQGTVGSKLSKTSSGVLDPAAIQSIIPDIEDTETQEKAQKESERSQFSTGESRNSVRGQSPYLRFVEKELPRFSIDRCSSGDQSSMSGEVSTFQSLSPGVNCHQESRGGSPCHLGQVFGASGRSRNCSPSPTVVAQMPARTRSPATLQGSLYGQEEKEALKVPDLEKKSQKRPSLCPSDAGDGNRWYESGLQPNASKISDSRSRSKSPMVVPSKTMYHRRLSEGSSLRGLSKSPIIFPDPNESWRLSSFDRKLSQDVGLSSRTSGSVTPRSVTPKSVTPKSATPKSATPRSATPKSATPRSATHQSHSHHNEVPVIHRPHSHHRGEVPATHRQRSQHKEVPATQRGLQTRSEEERWNKKTLKNNSDSQTRHETHLKQRRTEDERSAHRLQRHGCSSSSSESSSDSDWSESSSSDEDSSSDSSSALEDLVHLAIL